MSYFKSFAYPLCTLLASLHIIYTSFVFSFCVYIYVVMGRRWPNIPIPLICGLACWVEMLVSSEYRRISQLNSNKVELAGMSLTLCIIEIGSRMVLYLYMYTYFTFNEHATDEFIMHLVDCRYCCKKRVARRPTDFLENPFNR